MVKAIGKGRAIHQVGRRRNMYAMAPGTWLKVCQALDDETRNAFGNELTTRYPGLDPASDKRTVLTLDVRKFTLNQLGALTEALRKENIMVQELEFAEIDEMEDDTEDVELTETAAPAKKTRTRKPKKTGVVIPEGYGDQERGTWFPGYDAKWKSVLIKRVDSTGDQEAANEMVQRKWWTQEVADQRVDRFHNPPAKAAPAESAASAENRALAEEGLDDIDLD